LIDQTARLKAGKFVDGFAEHLVDEQFETPKLGNLRS
jgi:hypothetical protein